MITCRNKPYTYNLLITTLTIDPTDDYFKDHLLSYLSSNITAKRTDISIEQRKKTYYVWISIADDILDNSMHQWITTPSGIIHHCPIKLSFLANFSSVFFIQIANLLYFLIFVEEKRRKDKNCKVKLLVPIVPLFSQSNNSVNTKMERYDNPISIMPHHCQGFHEIKIHREYIWGIFHPFISE